MKFFAQIYDHWKPIQIKKYIAMKDIIESLNGKILDLGCGKCWLEKLFHKDFIGIDICKRYVKMKKRCIVGDINNLPFKSNSFDAIIAINVMQFVKTNDFLRVLKDRGKILIVTHILNNKIHELIKQMKIIEYRILQQNEISHIYLCEK